MAVSYFKNHFARRSKQEVMISTPKAEGTTLQSFRLNETLDGHPGTPCSLTPSGPHSFNSLEPSAEGQERPQVASLLQ